MLPCSFKIFTLEGVICSVRRRNRNRPQFPKDLLFQRSFARQVVVKCEDHVPIAYVVASQVIVKVGGTVVLAKAPEELWNQFFDSSECVSPLHLG